MDNEQSSASTGRAEPNEVPMFPLGTVLIPGAVLPLHIFEDRYREMIEFCIEHASNFGVVLIERGHEVGGGDSRSMVGTMASIIDHQRFADGRRALHVLGRNRVEIAEWLTDAPYPRALVRDLVDESGGATLERAEGVLKRMAEFTERANEMGYRINPLDSEAVAAGLDVAELSYRIAEMVPVGPFDKQRLLVVSTINARLDLLEEQIGSLLDILNADGNKP
tara:strand:+ start:18949 stop:19614 length:666 start_codon:yes stop_codon:yes gene_type:complete